MVATNVTEKPTWDEFMKRCDPWITTLASRLAYRFDLEFDDTRQTFVMYLWRAYPTFEPSRGAATTWCSMKYRWLAYWWTRQRRAKKRISPGAVLALTNADDEAIDIADPRARDPHDVAELRELVEMLPDAMEQSLTARERKVLRKRFGVGCERQTLQDVASGIGERERTHDFSVAFPGVRESVVLLSRKRDWFRRF